MPIAFWRDEYCTGDPIIDRQHQELFRIVNKLHDAMLEGHGSDVLGSTLDELTTYTNEHFDYEESRMRAAISRLPGAQTEAQKPKKRGRGAARKAEARGEVSEH